MKSSTAMPRRSRRPYVVAMVLGTALTALGPLASARAETVEATTRSITNMTRYCTTCWRNASLPLDCWNDATQEVFARLLQRVSPNSWSQVLQRDGEDRREFLRAIDTVKKRWQRSRKWSDSSIDRVADRREAADRQLREERQVVDRASEEVLTARQQRIMQMSFEGWSVQEIADDLDLSPERVSDEKYKAIRKLRTHLGVEA